MNMHTVDDESAIDTQKPRIIIVDDEEVMLETMYDVLTMNALYHVETARDAAEAIQKLKLTSFDLLISDLRMPGLSGVDLFHWITANYPEMTEKVLFTTGDIFDPNAKSFLQMVSRPCLEKPFDLKEFMEFVQDGLQD